MKFNFLLTLLVFEAFVFYSSQHCPCECKECFSSIFTLDLSIPAKDYLRCLEHKTYLLCKIIFNLDQTYPVAVGQPLEQRRSLFLLWTDVLQFLQVLGSSEQAVTKMWNALNLDLEKYSTWSLSDMLLPVWCSHNPWKTVLCCGWIDISSFSLKNSLIKSEVTSQTDCWGSVINDLPEIYMLETERFYIDICWKKPPFLGKKEKKKKKNKKRKIP